MKEEERAVLTARLDAFLKATGKNYLDGVLNNLIQEAECKTAILSDEEVYLISSRDDLL